MNNRKVIRTLFGDVENNERLRGMVDLAINNENNLLKENSSLQPITYLVLGDKNVEYLKKRNVKDIIKISSQPDIRPPHSISYYKDLDGNGKPFKFPEFPIYYNKTYLANEAFKLFGKNIEMLLLDMDVKIIKWPDEKMWDLYGLKKNNITHFQSPVRVGYRHNQRVPTDLNNNGLIKDETENEEHNE